MKVYPTSKFKKSFRRLPSSVQKVAIEKDKIFRKEPFSSHLKTHKLKGKLDKQWSYSVNWSYRAVFEFIDDNIVLYQDIGTHEVYK